MIRRFISWMEDRPRHSTGLRLLQIAIATALLYRVATEVPFASYLWGPHGVGVGSATSAFGRWTAALVNLFFQSDTGVRILLLLILIGCIGYLADLYTWLATVLLLFAFNALGNRSVYLLDGGDTILGITLVYLVLAVPKTRRKELPRWRVWLHNIGILAIFGQVMLVYTIAGLWKAGGRPWSQGTALYWISQVQEFSLPAAQSLFTNDVIVTVLTYGTVLFQTWFAIAIFSRLKIPWLIATILIHVGIAVVMGLISFSIVMIGLDLCLISDGEYEHARQILDAARARVVRQLKGEPIERASP